RRKPARAALAPGRFSSRFLSRDVRARYASRDRRQAAREPVRVLESAAGAQQQRTARTVVSQRNRLRPCGPAQRAASQPGAQAREQVRKSFSTSRATKGGEVAVPNR